MIWLLVIGMVLILIFGILLYVIYHLTFYNKNKHKNVYIYHISPLLVPYKDRLDEGIGEWLETSWEEHWITSCDGLRLKGYFLQGKKEAPLHILCHGYMGAPARDFCGIWQILRDMGHSILMIDERAHGESEGHTITYGIKERRDVYDWVIYAKREFGDVPIMLMGVSMGAATVLMTAGMKLPENVRAVVADCPYDSPANIIRKVAGVDMKLPVRLMYPIIRLSGKLFAGIDLESYSAVTGVESSSLPILLVHSDSDDFVPYEMSEALHTLAPERMEFHTIADAAHAHSCITEPEAYEKMLRAFIEKYMKQA